MIPTVHQLELPLLEKIARLAEEFFAFAESIKAKAFRDELTADWRTQHSDLISGENSVEALLKRIQEMRGKVVKDKGGKKKIVREKNLCF